MLTDWNERNKKSSGDCEKLRLCSLCSVCDGNNSLETSTVMLLASPDGWDWLRGYA